MNELTNNRQYDILADIFRRVGHGEFMAGYLSGLVSPGMMRKLTNRRYIISTRNAPFGGGTKIWKISDEWANRLERELGICPSPEQSLSYINERIKTRASKKILLPPDVFSVVGLREIKYRDDTLVKSIGSFNLLMLNAMMRLAKNQISDGIVEVVSIKHNDGSNAIGIRKRDSDLYVICCPVVDEIHQIE